MNHEYFLPGIPRPSTVDSEGRDVNGRRRAQPSVSRHFKSTQSELVDPSMPSAAAMIRDRLGTPYFTRSGVSIYIGDCLELMRAVPPSIVNLTVTSPPYNIGKEYERRLDLEDYITWCACWCTEVFRICSADGTFWLNLGYVSVPGLGRAVPIPYLLWKKLAFFLQQEVVWNYGAGVAARRMFSPRNEKWLWMLKNPESYTFNLDAVRDPDVKYPNQKKNGKLRVNPMGKNPSDVWCIPKVTTGTNMDGQRASRERTKHPAQFPEAVIERIVLASSNAGDVIFDPFAGSGTTGAVALQTSRDCVLFEVDERYAEMAARRLESVAIQPRLLDQVH